MTGFAWGVGIAAAGAIFGSCNWGRGDVNINVNRATNIDRNFNRTNVGGGGQWQHDASHRKGVAYRDNASREKFGKDVPGAAGRKDFRGRDGGPGDRGRTRGVIGAGRGGIEAASAIAADREEQAGSAIAADREEQAGSAIAADREEQAASAIAADREEQAASAIAADREEQAGSAIAADPEEQAAAGATTHSRASATAQPRNATSTAGRRAISRWRTAAVAAQARAPAEGHGRARAPAAERGQVPVRAAERGRAQAAAARAPAAVVVVAAAGARETRMRTVHRHACKAAATRFAAVVAALALCIGWMPAAFAQQKTFASADAAMNAFGDAVATSDEDALKALLGADFRTYIPPVGAEGRYRFLAAWAKSHAIQPDGDAKAHVAVGGDGWTMPIPIVKTAQGWRFDTRAGADEMRLRRIGRNELAVMQVMLAIYDAEKDYARKDHNGDGVLEYATKFTSSSGKQDGLYWPTKAGEPSSPLGPAVAAARAAGSGGDAGYYGYRYKILTGQGKNAPGGAFDYVVRGRMIGGFAVVGLAGQVRRDRRDDVHREPRRRRVREGPRSRYRRARERHDPLRSGLDVAEGRARQAVAAPGRTSHPPAGT